MIALLGLIAIRLLLCALLSWLNWKTMGASGLAFTAPLYGIALARPLLDLASELRHQMRRAGMAGIEGHHYAFRGRPVRVHTDAQCRRWIRLADIRAIVGHTAGDASLQVVYAAGFRRIGGEACLSDEALLTHLGKESSPAALKLRPWVEREIVFPARRERERLGIQVGVPEFQPSD